MVTLCANAQAIGEVRQLERVLALDVDQIADTLYEEEDE
jgi:hypothetical protein